VQRGLTVLTKSDLVDEESLAVTRLEVEEFVRGSFLDPAKSPIVAVSAKTGAGLDDLRRELARVAAEAPTKDSSALLRLPIDRVFTMKGFGTVVTGTLVSGTARKDEEVDLFPGARRVRVRGVQVHGAAAEQAIAGQRTALNLAGVATEDLGRGMMLAAPGRFRTTERVAASMTLLAGAKPLKNGARVHFHCYTAETIAEVRIYAGEGFATPATPGSAQVSQIAPGETAFVQLRLAEPALLLPGDRFILRQFSPVVTIGGGTVLDAFPSQARKHDEKAAAEFLRVVETSAPRQILAARIARRGAAGLSKADAVAETGWRPEQVESLVAELAAERRLARAGDVLVSAEAFLAAAQSLVRTLHDFHAQNPLVGGISKEELRNRAGVGTEVFSGLAQALSSSGKIELVGEQVRLAGRSVVMKDEEAAAKQKIEQAFASAGLKVPALKEVLASLAVDRTRAQKIVTLLLRDRVLIKLSDDLVFHRDALELIRRRVQEYKQTSEKIDVARFKDLAGVTRKYAIPLLEYLDRERVTRRVGDERVIL
jgi:selenocysteine-specific elongation factor